MVELHELQLPSTWVASGYGVPQVCSRHGQPAVDRRRIRLVSSPPGWAYPLILVGGFAFVAARLATRRTVQAPAWPLCQRCREQRVRSLTLGVLLLILGILTFCTGTTWFVNDSSNSKTGLMVLLGLAILVAGAVATGRGRIGGLVRARVSQDGRWVTVREAHPAFAEQVRTVLPGQAYPDPGGPPPGQAYPGPGGPPSAPPR